MATPFVFNVFIEYEDANGALTGDQDVFTFYCTDVTLAKATIGSAAGGNSFVFARGPCRITDLISAAAATVVRLQLIVNNLPRNVYWLLAAQVALAQRKVTNIRLAAGSQIEFLQI